MPDSLILQELYLYPIKSLGGISVNQAEVEERGFRYDRRWMLVDKTGEFLTQRQYPQLALLQAALGNTQLEVFSKVDSLKRIAFDLELVSSKELSVKIWGDVVLAWVVSEEVSNWFSDFLGMELDLVVMPESTERKMDPRYAVQGESVSFADGMPYVIIGQSSLDELNGRLANPVGMDRFRPNLVFSGGDAFAEDQFTRLKVGEVAFQVVKPCGRCVLITVNQQTAEQGKEPLATLATYRTVNNKVYFGQNAIALGTGTVRVGDRIRTSFFTE
ncbi:MAG: MOSC domain-containing protein [Bacteroidetes bacterium]|nr:MOSC domain-containing protein [Bacteroidota bacterium]MDA1269066.1 MOSC domain-containing protein [Bacteroidota bacterium]